ncbi:hypothetical protein RKD27_004277 [Streptomyces sp. SAI-126]
MSSGGWMHLDEGVSKSDDYEKTSTRLTMWGCLAGLTLALICTVGFPLLVAVSIYVDGR